jgi:putative transcriptional regulator
MDMTDKQSNETFKHLRGQLLLAMPGLADSGFAHAVVYICEHTPEGAMGLIVNQPINVPLKQIFSQLDLPCPEKLNTQQLLLGGPVQQERGFILHRNTDKKWQSTMPVGEQISLTASQDIIEALASNEGPEDSLVALGYAGWGAGQLEQELLANAWLTAPTDAEFLFDTPFDSRARLAAARIGVDINQLSNSAGHA